MSRQYEPIETRPSFERDGEPLVTPISVSTTFHRDGLESDPDHKYSRESNPTVSVLEAALGKIEDALPAVCYGSGLAAETGLFFGLLRSGDHVVCSRAVYGGTTRILEQFLAGLGIGATFADSSQPEAIVEAIEDRTRLVFVETPSNPTLAITDIAAIAQITRSRSIPLAVDNTFLTAHSQRPLDLGADFSVYSTTKFIEGHSTALGGAIVSRHSERLEHLRWVRKCTGTIQSPFSAWLTLQGMKTLGIRLDRQTSSASLIASSLQKNPGVAIVHYPGLLEGKARETADRQHLAGHGAVLSFELQGGEASARRFLQEVRSARLVEHVGSVETLLTHPATMTHGAVAPEALDQVGVSPGLLRLSVGLEDPLPILADLNRSIEVAVRTRQEEVSSCA